MSLSLRDDCTASLFTWIPFSGGGLGLGFLSGFCEAQLTVLENKCDYVTCGVTQMDEPALSRAAVAH